MRWRCRALKIAAPHFRVEISSVKEFEQCVWSEALFHGDGASLFDGAERARRLPYIACGRAIDR